MPPTWMWHLSEALEEHFEKVKERRRSGNPDREDDEPQGPMIQNEHARGRGRAMAANHV